MTVLDELFRLPGVSNAQGEDTVNAAVCIYIRYTSDLPTYLPTIYIPKIKHRTV
jgi:hypothetical protein